MSTTSKIDLGELTANRDIAGRNYWRKKLEGLRFKPYLPVQPGSAVQESPAGRTGYGELSANADQPLYERIRQVTGTDQGRHILLLSALAIFLHKYSLENDLAIFTFPLVTSGATTAPDNIVPTRIDRFSGRDFSEFLLNTKKLISADYSHGSYPWSKIAELVSPPSDSSRITCMTVTEIKEAGSFAPYSPGLIIAFGGQGEFRMNIRYDESVYDKRFINLIPDAFFDLLRKLIASPHSPIGQIALARDVYPFCPGPAGDHTPQDQTGATIVSLFRRQARATPAAPAISFGREEIDYSTLDETTDRLALQLKDRGIAPGDMVAICLERSIPFITAMLGVLKAGAAYLPLDPTYPGERLNFMIDDCHARLILTSRNCMTVLMDRQDKERLLLLEEEFAGLLPDRVSAPDRIAARLPRPLPALTISPSDLAYVMYTSGSTGRPKGVMVNHRNVTSLVDHPGFVQFSENDCLLSTGSPSFDATTFEYWGMLLNGGKLVLIPENTLFDLPAVKSVIKQQSVNLIWLTSSLLNQWVNLDISVFEGLQTVIAGGEKLSSLHIQKLLNRYGDLTILNGYGPTENTTFSLTYTIPRGPVAQNIPIGKPLSGRGAYVLTENKEPCPAGMTGEIYVSGAGVSKGYLGLSDLTAQRFIPDPFAQGPGSMMYRTGDIGRYLPDGNIEFIGRNDNQVKIRGVRIELGEIEKALDRYDGIIASVAIVKTTEEQEAYIVVFYTAEPGVEINDVKNYVSGVLPASMQPSKFVPIKKMPLTANGKLDRQSLHDLPEGALIGPPSFVPASDELEERLILFFAQILRTEPLRVSVTDSFFELGGNSLRAMTLANRIQGELQAAILVKDIFEGKTVRNIGNIIKRTRKAGYLPLRKAEWQEYYELSIAQLRLYYLAEFNRSETTFNIPLVAKLKGNVDKQRILLTFQKLVDRHEALRTSMKIVDDRPVQLIAEHLDFDPEYACVAEDQLDRAVRDFIRPFDLEHAPLFRAGLLEVSSDTYYLIVDMHHIISDGTSLGILVKDFMNLYNHSDLPPLTLHYKDYAARALSESYQKQIAHQRDFWVRSFSEPITPLDIPIDYEQQDLKKGDAIFFSLDKDNCRKLANLAEAEVATHSMILLAALSVLLYRISGQQDIVIGMAVAGREQVEAENMIGMFAMVLPFRTRPRPDISFRDYLGTIKSGFIDTIDNQSYPYEDLAAELGIARNTGRNPWFDVIFLYQNYETANLDIPGIEVSAYEDQNVIAHEEFNLFAQRDGDLINFKFVYSMALFKRETAERYLSYYLNMVKEVLEDPDLRLSAIEMTEPSVADQIGRGPVVPTHGPDRFWDAFLEQVAKTPDNVAVEHNDRSFTYRELLEAATALSDRLRASGLKAGDHIAVLMERGIGMLTALLAIFKTGGTYIPIDPENPAARIEDILSDSNAAAILTTTASGGLLVDMCGQAAPATTDEPNLPLAYLIYTSGTTGKPKGVMVRHDGMLNHLMAKVNDLHLGASDSIAQTASAGFDISIWQFLAALLVGGKSYIIDKEKTLDPDLLLAEISKGHITIVELAPSLIGALLADQEARHPIPLENVRWMISTGEPLTVAIVRHWLTIYPSIPLMNAYGPTEASDDITHYQVTPPCAGQVDIPIGRPIQNMRIYVVDEQMNQCPPGAKGEICVAGIGVGKGYWKNTFLTAERFLPNPFLDEREPVDNAFSILYRTGDMGYFGVDGNLRCLGRKDNQVKLRGFRIEPAEVECRLLAFPGIKQAIVIISEATGDPTLIAYYISDTGPDLIQMRRWLAEFLPAYMIPAYLIRVEKFPLTLNGKIDRKALPAPVTGPVEVMALPSGDSESGLVTIWSEVLGVPENTIGVNRNFFELGGNSLKLLRLRSAINKRMHWDISIHELFKYPEIGCLCDYVNRRRQLSVK